MNAAKCLEHVWLRPEVLPAKEPAPIAMPTVPTIFKSDHSMIVVKAAKVEVSRKIKCTLEFIEFLTS